MNWIHRSRFNVGHILLTTVMLAVLGVYGYYYGCELVAKWAFANRTYFDADELILITLPQSDLSSRNEFLVTEGEFDWQGQMVDVLHREVRSDTLYIYGFRDEAETALKKEAAWLYEPATGSTSMPNTNAKRLKWLGEFILPNQTVIIPAACRPIPQPQPYFAYSSTLFQRPLLDIPHPPPNSPF